MKTINSKKILLALLAAAMLLSMAACGKKDGDGEEGAAPDLIEEYPFGEESVSGLMSDESTAAVSASTVVTYSYTGLSSPGSTVNTYVTLMTDEVNGFSIVDSDFVMSDEPVYDEKGKVLLAKNAETEAEEAAGDGEEAVPVNRLLVLDISWDENGCEVVTREAEGVIAPPPEPMTMLEAQRYLKGLSPERLGLEGESMDKYDVFAFDGTIIVDGRACVRMNVYSIDNVEQSNEFMGCYLMSLDGRHLYRLDTSTSEITELD